MIGAKFPEAVFLRRPDRTGYGFFFYNEVDFRHAVDSFTKPVLHSFSGTPIPGQPDPQDHLRTAIATFLGQAFDKAVSRDIGSEGVSRAAAAIVAETFPGPIPRVVVIERPDSVLKIRPGIEFMRHPGFPLAVVVDGDTHGGEARYFAKAEDFEAIGQSEATPKCWLPQIVYRLYGRTPSVMAGRPTVDRATGKHSVECRGLTFGMPAPLEERTNA